MAGLKRFKYTDKDHAAIVADCIERIKQVYGEAYWNDFEEDNAGVMLIEAFAYIADLLLFYLDRQANESYLPTAQERQNLINICKLVGYVPKNAVSAQAEIKISIDEPHASDITLPAKSQISTNAGLIFEISGDAVIKAGELFTTVNALEGETYTDNTGVSDGNKYQEFYIGRSGIVEIQEVLIDNEAWEYVDSFVEYSESDKIYSAEIDAWQRGKISFGDGKNGAVPEKNARIYVTYRVGGGIRGNVAPNTITSVRDVAKDADGNTIPVKITNEDWASGGSEPESINHIKLYAPRYFKTQDRCVTQDDYETFAVYYGGIAKAKAVVRERSGEANIIRIYVLSYGQKSSSVAVPNETLKNNLLEYLENYKMLTDWIEIKNGTWKAVDFSGEITILDGFNAADILEKINAALNSLMDIDSREMGETLRISDVYAIIDNIEGVDYVELVTPSETVNAESNELLTLGSVNFTIKTVNNGSSGKNI